MRILSKIDSHWHPLLELEMLNPPDARRFHTTLKAIEEYKCKGVVISPKMLKWVRDEFPDLPLIITSNYDGLSPSEVLLREIESITSLVEDMDNLTIEFRLPNDCRQFLVDFQKLNKWVKLSAFIEIDTLRRNIHSLEKNKSFERLGFRSMFDYNAVLGILPTKVLFKQYPVKINLESPLWLAYQRPEDFNFTLGIRAG